MSIKEPGIMFDATNSWNGYNHQGKIALWYAIGEIIKLIDPSISTTLNRQVLLDYFLEIEYALDQLLDLQLDFKEESTEAILDHWNTLITN